MKKLEAACRGRIHLRPAISSAGAFFRKPRRNGPESGAAAPVEYDAGLVLVGAARIGEAVHVDVIEPVSERKLDVSLADAALQQYRAVNMNFSMHLLAPETPMLVRESRDFNLFRSWPGPGDGIIPPPPCPRTRNERIERHRKHGAFLRLRERRARRARRKVRQVRHQQGPRAPAPEREHRAEEGLLRLGTVQGVQIRHA